MKATALIMAGGRGERFWPRSRQALPKQFLSLTDDGKTMIQLTVERISALVDLEDVYIATNEAYRELVLAQLPGLPEQNILCEPVGRNTAPCIGLGAMHISRKYEDALMMVLPSDHLVRSTPTFVRTICQGLEIAETSPNLVTIGITPNYPETGYGYIRYNPDETNGHAFAVDRFVEKPCLEKAQEYLRSGDYLWNSGMFLWRVSSILDNIKTHMPDLYDGLQAIGAAIGTPNETRVLKELFPTLPSESIDYGIMEKASHIFSLPGNFGWDDVGSWLAMGRIRKSDAEGNVLRGNIATVDTNHCIIESSGKLIATVGIEDLIVIDTDDVTLICDKTHAGDIKKILAKLREEGQTQYL